MPISNLTPTYWRELRPDMTCREAIVARMAEDVDDLIHAAGQFGTVGIDDLVRLGWTEKQAWAHAPDIFRRAKQARQRKRVAPRLPPPTRRVA